MSTVAEIAAAWKCSRQAVAKWVKKGMPTTSIDAASSWRLGHGQRSPRAKLFPVVQAPVPIADGDFQSEPALIHGDNQTSVRERARKAERAAYAILQERIASKDVDGIAGALKAYNEARKGREGAELAFIKHQQATEVLVDREAITAMFNRRITMFRDHLLSLPDAMALRCNPNDPQGAAEALQEWVERTLRVVAES